MRSERLFRPVLRPLGAPLALALLLGLAPARARAAEHVYVPDGSSDTVAVVDAAGNTVVATIPAGDRPLGLAVSPDRSRVYVANGYSNDLTVIATTTRTVFGTVPVGDSPFGVAVSPNGQRVYVSNRNDDSISVIDAGTLTVVATISIPPVLPWGPDPQGLVVSPSGARLYVANWADGTIAVIDTATNSLVGRIQVGQQFSQLAINPAGTRLYAGSFYTGPNPSQSTLFVIDTATNQVIATPQLATCESISVSPDGSRIYLPHRYLPQVDIVDAASLTLLASVPVNSLTFSASLNRDGSKLYLLDASQVVRTLDTATFAVTSTGALLPPGNMAFGNSFVVEVPEPCRNLAVQPASLHFPNFGGGATFQVVAQPGCKWVVSGMPPWLGVNPPGGLGPATVSVTAQMNFHPFPRSATLWVSPAVGPSPGVAVQVLQD